MPRPVVEGVDCNIDHDTEDPRQIRLDSTVVAEPVKQAGGWFYLRTQQLLVSGKFSEPAKELVVFNRFQPVAQRGFQ